MDVYYLSENNDRLKQPLDKRITLKLGSEEEKITGQINQVLHEHNENDFEGFTMTSVDGITGIDILALSYIFQVRLEIDPVIRKTSAEIFLKIYFNDVFRKLVRNKGLIERARELLEKYKDNLSVAEKLNEEYAGVILKDLKLVKDDFARTQKRLIQELGSGFINIENKEEKSWAALQRIFGQVDLESLGDPDKMPMEKVEVITGSGVLHELKRERFNPFKFGEAKTDPVKLSNLVYVIRALFNKVNKRIDDRPEEIVRDGYIRQIMDVYLHAYDVYLRKNIESEEEWLSSTEKIVRYYTGTSILIEKRTDKYNFQIYEQKMADIIDRIAILSQQHEQELKKTDLPAQAIVELLRQNISKKNHWSRDARLNQLVGALSDGLSEGGMKNYLEMTNTIFQERELFLKNNMVEIKEKLVEMERLAKEAIVRKNFLDLKNGQIKVDYFSQAYNSVIENPDLANMNTNEMVVTFKCRVNSLFLSYIKDFIDDIINFDQLPDYQKTQAVKISKLIDDLLPKSQNASFLDRAGIIKIIEAINILCRLFRSKQLEIDNNITNNKITILPTVTLEFQKTMVEYIDEYRVEIDRINNLIFN